MTRWQKHCRRVVHILFSLNDMTSDIVQRMMLIFTKPKGCAIINKKISDIKILLR